MLTPSLTDIEIRILGSLMEKEVTTPDNYPLSMSALVAACNQLSSREPVMQLDEPAVTDAMVALRRRSLLRAIQPSGSRVTKYMHLLGDALSLDARELAVLGVLMLRGAQTPGELHQRTARLADFAGMPELEATLEGLMAREPEALVMRLPRRAGQKEARYAHLLGGEPAVPDEAEPPTPHADAPSGASSSRDEALESLQRAVGALREELASLRAQFEAFRGQFQ